MVIINVFACLLSALRFRCIGSIRFHSYGGEKKKNKSSGLPENNPPVDRKSCPKPDGATVPRANIII